MINNNKMIPTKFIKNPEKECPNCSTEYKIEKIDYCTRCGLKKKSKHHKSPQTPQNDH